MQDGFSSCPLFLASDLPIFANMKTKDEHKTFRNGYAPVNSPLVPRDEDDLDPPVFCPPFQGFVLRDGTVFPVGGRG